MPDPRELAAEIAKYEARLASEPHSRVFAQLADAYRKAGRLDEAIRTCRSGLREHATYVSARMVLGRALAEKGQLPEAEKELAIVLELSPATAVAHRLLGDLAAAQGKRDDARRHYETALGLSPQDMEARGALQRLTEAPSTATKAPGEVPTGGGGEPGVAGRAVAASDAGPAVEEAAAEPGTSSEAVGLATETLADLYAQQGFAGRAAEIYQELLRKEPDRSDLRQKLEQLQSQMSSRVAEMVEPAGPVKGGSGIARLERWREAVRRRKGSASGGGA